MRSTRYTVKEVVLSVVKNCTGQKSAGEKPQAKLETLEAIIKEVEGMPNDKVNGLKQKIAGESMWLSKQDLLTKLRAEKKLIEKE